MAKRFGTPYVYKVRHITTGQYYIGFRCQNKHEPWVDFGNYYKTSSSVVKSNFDLFELCFIKVFTDKESAYDAEQQLIFDNWTDPFILNRSCFKGKHRFSLINGTHTDEWKSVMSQKFKGRSNFWNIGTKHSEETKRLIGEKSKGRPHLADLCRANSAKRIGIPLTEERKKKLSESMKKRTKTPEHIFNATLARCAVCVIPEKRSMSLKQFDKWLLDHN